MRLIQYGLGALALLLVGCVTSLLPGGRNILTLPPLSRLFLGGSGRNLRAEVEAAYPQFIVPEDRVEYPKQRLAALKSRLKEIGHHKVSSTSTSSGYADGSGSRSPRPPIPAARPAATAAGVANGSNGRSVSLSAALDNDEDEDEEDEDEEEENAQQQPGDRADSSPNSARFRVEDDVEGEERRRRALALVSSAGSGDRLPPTAASSYPRHWKEAPPAFMPLGVPPPPLFPPHGAGKKTSKWSLFKSKLPRPGKKRPIGILRINPLPPGKTPLVAVVNSKSGGRQGKNLLKRLRNALSRAQVFDIQKVDLKEALRLYAHLNNPITLLVCGGDGTASRVFEVVDSMEWRHGPPKIAILPLGTGNDLARTLDWNQGYDWSGGYFSWGSDADASLLSVFGDLTRGLERRMDRWEIQLTEAVPSLERHKQPVKYMLGYLGIGVDGKVALDFHKLRERAPFLFVSPVLNKFYYALMGLKDFFWRSCKNLPEKVELWCDGKPVTLPPETEAFIVLNINSHAGGVELWPELPALPALPGQPSTEVFKPSRFDDGYLEVVAISGVLHLGRIRVGLDRPIRLAQAREVRIRTKSFLPGQVDGEPWRVPRCELTLRHKGQAPVLQHLSKELLQYNEWLVGQGKLDASAKDQLLNAFKRRIAANQ